MTSLHTHMSRPLPVAYVLLIPQISVSDPLITSLLLVLSHSMLSSVSLPLVVIILPDMTHSISIISEAWVKINITLLFFNLGFTLMTPFLQSMILYQHFDQHSLASFLPLPPCSNTEMELFLHTSYRKGLNF